MSAFLMAVTLATLGSPAELPNSLEINVSYFDGLIVNGPDRPWRATIRDPGRSTFTDLGQAVVRISISSAKLATLRATLERERFFELPSHYGDMVVDGPERALEVRLGDRVKMVKIYSISRTSSKKGAAEVDRVMRVWRSITDCLNLKGRAAA